jgi:hypothetical protein
VETQRLKGAHQETHGPSIKGVRDGRRKKNNVKDLLIQEILWFSHPYVFLFLHSNEEETPRNR